MILTIDEKFDLLLGELKKINNRMDAMENRMEAMENRMEAMENRMDELESQTQAVMSNQLELYKKITLIEKRIEVVYDLAVDNWGNMVETKQRLKMLEA